MLPQNRGRNSPRRHKDTKRVRTRVSGVCLVLFVSWWFNVGSGMLSCRMPFLARLECEPNWIWAAADNETFIVAFQEALQVACEVV